MGLFVEVVVFLFCFGGFLETGDGFLLSKLVVVRDVGDDDDSMFVSSDEFVSFFLFYSINLSSFKYIQNFPTPFWKWKESGN